MRNPLGNFKSVTSDGAAKGVQLPEGSCVLHDDVLDGGGIIDGAFERVCRGQEEEDFGASQRRVRTEFGPIGKLLTVFGF